MGFLNFFNDYINLMRIPAVLIAIVLHEMAHGLAALWLGDPTAKMNKRLSLNPLRHIDPVGALMLLIVGFGWAKPVGVDMRYFKNPKRGMAYCAMAGPAMNFLVAFTAMLVLSITAHYNTIGVALSIHLRSIGSLFDAWVWFWLFLTQINIALGFFNLIPIPPLDGSKILFSLLPNELYYTVLRYERYGILVLMITLFSGALDKPLSTAIGNILIALQWMTGQITSLLPGGGLS
jgi:Zn-dependent protease